MGKVIILVGPPGSGKTTECLNSLGTYKRISQDDMGKKAHWNNFVQELTLGTPQIVVDRTNYLKEQRLKYLAEAKRFGYETKIVYFDVDYETCLERLLKRVDHPTITSLKIAEIALKTYFKLFESISDDEADTISGIS